MNDGWIDHWEVGHRVLNVKTTQDHGPLTWWLKWSFRRMETSNEI